MYIICSLCRPGGRLFLSILWLAYIIFRFFFLLTYAFPFFTGYSGEQVFERFFSDSYYFPLLISVRSYEKRLILRIPYLFFFLIGQAWVCNGLFSDGINDAMYIENYDLE